MSFLRKTSSCRAGKARPLLVAWGSVARSFLPSFWVDRLFDDLRFWLSSRPVTESANVIITDVRYVNEVQRIHDCGGIVIRIHRPDTFPANVEEERSFRDIEASFLLPEVTNNGTPAELGQQVLQTIRNIGHKP